MGFEVLLPALGETQVFYIASTVLVLAWCIELGRGVVVHEFIKEPKVLCLVAEVDVFAVRATQVRYVLIFVCHIGAIQCSMVK
jgi:hypothetical protein